MKNALPSCIFFAMLSTHSLGQVENPTLSLNIPHGNSLISVRLAAPTHPDTRTSLGSVSSLCAGIDTIIYTHASHPGGSHNGWPNENNGGRGNRCFISERRTWYILLGGLENSQYGNTLVFGPGFKFTFPEMFRTSIDVGIEVPFVYYELYATRGAVQGFLPIGYLGVSYRLGKTATIGLLQMWLPMGGVTLRGMVINTPLPIGLENGVPTQPPGGHPSSFTGTKARPSIVLQYRF